MLCTPSSNEALRGSESASSMPATSSRKARAWKTKPVVMPNAHARRIHRQAAGEVRVVRTDDHATITARSGRALVQHELELRGTLLLPLCGAVVAEDLERQAIRMAGGDTGDLHHTDGVLELGAEAGVVVVLDRLIGVAHCGLPMADDGAEWHRPLRDGSRESAAAHLLHVAAEELDEVRNVAADVGERAGARCSLVPPADRPLRVARVVAPVAAVNVQDATQRAGGDEFAEGSNALAPGGR